MSISYPPISQNSGPEVLKVITALSANVVALAANPARTSGCFAVNNASKTMYVSFDGNPASPSAGSAAVPGNGGVIDIPAGYTGVVNAVWQAGVTGAAIFHEFSYV